MIGQIAQLFIGVVLAALLFAATFFSAAQVFRQTGALQRSHGLCVVAMLGVMACLSAGFFALAQVLGLGLLVGGIWAVWVESGWNLLLALIQVAFGAAVLAGLPFGGSVLF